METPAPSSTLRRSLAGWLISAVIPLLAAPVAAQSSPNCDTLLPSAHAYYIDQQFEVAERAVRDCVSQPALDDAQAQDAYRLLALVHLRQARLPEAEQAVTQLLDVSSDYTPDAVLDPPAYVALVGTIREQHTASAPTEPWSPSSDEPVASDMTTPAMPSSEPGESEAAAQSGGPERIVHISASLGAGSYSGERGINGGSLAKEFSLNGGFSFALDGSYAVRTFLSAVAGYRAVRLPLLLTNDVRADDVQVRPEDSSAWVHILSVMARGYIHTDTPMRPFLQGGVSGFFSYLNNELSVGVGPQFGFGLDVPVTYEIMGFAEFNVAMSLPGDAVDRVSTSTSSDLLTFMGAGLRYQLPAR